MNPHFVITTVEAQEDVCFVGGTSLSSLTTGQCFDQLLQAASPKKMHLRTTLALTVESLIVSGEPVENVEEGAALLLVLSGDQSALLASVQALRWRRKSRRYLHTRGDSLLLAST